MTAENLIWLQDELNEIDSIADKIKENLENHDLSKDCKLCNGFDTDDTTNEAQTIYYKTDNIRSLLGIPQTYKRFNV
jgi:hypothetical protein